MGPFNKGAGDLIHVLGDIRATIIRTQLEEMRPVKTVAAAREVEEACPREERLDTERRWLETHPIHQQALFRSVWAGVSGP